MDEYKPQTITIHGKEYIPVHERIKMAHGGEKLQGVKTLVLQHEPNVVIQATVNISGIEYQGISSANIAKTIEKANPYEVAETSAVGRALGFAGFGIIDSIASSDEMHKAGVTLENKEYFETKTKGYTATLKQIKMIRSLLAEKGYTIESLLNKYEVTKVDDLTIDQASTIIKNLIEIAPKPKIEENALDIDEIDKAIGRGK